MNASETLVEPAKTPFDLRPNLSATSHPHKRPFLRRLMQFIRRTHLYVGLFLFPWAVLYGVTGLLFNHPTFLADSPTETFRRSDLVGTPLENLPDIKAQADAVLAGLNELKQPSTPFTLANDVVRYGARDSFIATVKAEHRSFFVVFDPKSGSGTIRESTPKTAASDPAPFATGKTDGQRQRGMGMMGPMKHDHAGVKIADSITDRLKDAIPNVMEKKGFPRGEVTVTTAPDIKFEVNAAGKTWLATYNPLTTSVTGTTQKAGDLSFRTFLLRMHLTRGYPGEFSTKWIWAVGVDAIAVALFFWGVSGLLMWWQIKSTRRLGLVVLATSAIVATLLGIGMHGLLSA